VISYNPFEIDRRIYILKMSSVPKTAHSEDHMVLELSDSLILGSIPAKGIAVCPPLSVLCCPVYVEALRRADAPYVCYQLSIHRFRS